jgi:hypothetical protein
MSVFAYFMTFTLKKVFRPVVVIPVIGVQVGGIGSVLVIGFKPLMNGYLFVIPVNLYPFIGVFYVYLFAYILVRNRVMD